MQPGVYVVSLALLFPLSIALLIARDGVDVPAYDDWARFPLLVKLNAGTLSWGDLASPLSEHRLLFPNILFLLIARLTGWNVKYEMAATLLVTCVTMLNLCLLGNATLGGTSIRRRVAFLLTCMLLFGPIQSDNWLWGIQTAVVIPIACTTGCILLAQSRVRAKARLGLCLALAGIATFSFGSGLLCWIVVLPVLLLEVAERREVRPSLWVWVFGMIAAWAAYLAGYSPKGHRVLAMPLANLGTAVAYSWRFLGSPFARGTPADPMVIALAIGALECGLFAAACAYLGARRDLRLARRMVPWVAVGLFAALSGVLVTLARMSIDTPLASRYATTAVLMPIALLHLVPIVCEDAWSRSYITELTRRAIPYGLAAVMIPLHVTTSIVGVESAVHSREARLAGKAATMFVNFFVDEEMLQIGFEFERATAYAKYFSTLERLGYMRPGLVRGGGIDSLVRTRGSAGRGVLDGSCGIIESADRTTAQGWALSPQKDGQADAVLLAFDGEAGQPTPFAVSSVGLGTSSAGWTKVFPGKVPAMATRIFAWALDTESGKICSLTTPTGADSLPLPAPGLPIDSIGVMTPTAAGNIFSLRNSNTSGPADVTTRFGAAGDIPVAGDWDGDGMASVGVYRPGDNTFYLRNSNGTGPADLVIHYGAKGDIPVVGDWNGDGVTTIGVYRPREHAWYLRNSNTAGMNDVPIILYGWDGDYPVVGDWNGDGVDTIGVYRPSQHAWYLRNSNTSGTGDVAVVVYGLDGDVPVVGDWSGDGRASIGVYRPSEGTFSLRITKPTGGPTDLVARFGAYGRLARPGGVPIIGDWDGR